MLKQSFLCLIILLLHKVGTCQVMDSVILPNAVLYYYSYGTGEPLILLSGGPGGSGRSMDHMINELNKKYQVILFDQRGTGRSWTKPFDSTTINLPQAIDDLDALRKKLGISKLNLLGRSWGSMLAAGYIATYPSHVKLFISICGGELDISLRSTKNANIFAFSSDRDSSIYRRWNDPEIKKQAPAKAAYELTRLHMLTRVYDSSKIDLVISRQQKQGSGNRQMSSLMWKSIEEKLHYSNAGHNFKGKTLLIFGWHDPISLTTISQYMQAFPHATVQGIYQSGHFPETEMPHLFYPVVNDFLESSIDKKKRS
jgi:proline-specific peptidase